MKAIVAVDENWGIGREGKLLCLISADLKRFKALTMGCPVILGRKTLATFPGGKPLPGRDNLILSRDPRFKVEGARAFSSIPAVLKAADDNTFVIGGETIYNSLLEYCDLVYVTKILHSFAADAWFPDLDKSPQWEVSETGELLEEKGISFRYLTYVRTRGGKPLK